MALRRPLKKYLIPTFLFLLLLSRCRPLIFFTEWHFPFTPHFSKSYVVLAPGDVYALKVGGFPSILNCQSSVPLTASVTPGGVVHAWKCGKTVITAALRTKNGKKIRCLVHVTELNQKSLTLCVGKSKRIYLKGFFFGFGVKYKSSDSSVARVSGTGKVTAVKKGRAIITLTVKGKDFQCKVTVK